MAKRTSHYQVIMGTQEQELEKEYQAKDQRLEDLIVVLNDPEKSRLLLDKLQEEEPELVARLLQLSEQLEK
ncbi:MAG: hypothetical protein Q8R55_05310 [Candidatus Taylorbacteria bacterium]|nr:hypothetical protein [Candidatus Taylorbacteria bacterium]